MIPRDPLLHHVQRMLMHDLEVSYAEVQPDGDGDLVVCTSDEVPVVVRLVTRDDEVWARLWSVAASGLQRSAKLLREVNEINAHMVGARVLLTDQGSLVVAGEVVARSLEHGEIAALLRVIGDTVTEVGSLVQLVFGTSGASETDAPRGSGAP